jgi:hypothetical protein
MLYTLRGQMVEGENRHLVVDDGNFNRGYRVTRFVIAGDNTGQNDIFATLSLDYDAPLTWDWGDNRQIGWASGPDLSSAPMFEVIDPKHTVVRDLYLQAQVGGGGGSSIVNYLIQLESVSLTDDEAVLALIKERSQDDPR